MNLDSIDGLYEAHLNEIGYFRGEKDLVVNVKGEPLILNVDSGDGTQKPLKLLLPSKDVINNVIPEGHTVYHPACEQATRKMSELMKWLAGWFNFICVNDTLNLLEVVAITSSESKEMMDVGGEGFTLINGLPALGGTDLKFIRALKKNLFEKQIPIAQVSAKRIGAGSDYQRHIKLILNFAEEFEKEAPYGIKASAKVRNNIRTLLERTLGRIEGKGLKEYAPFYTAFLSAVRSHRTLQNEILKSFRKTEQFKDALKKGVLTKSKLEWVSKDSKFKSITSQVNARFEGSEGIMQTAGASPVKSAPTRLPLKPTIQSHNKKPGASSADTYSKPPLVPSSRLTRDKTMSNQTQQSPATQQVSNGLVPVKNPDGTIIKKVSLSADQPANSTAQFDSAGELTGYVMNSAPAQQQPQQPQQQQQPIQQPQQPAPLTAEQRANIMNSGGLMMQQQPFMPQAPSIYPNMQQPMQTNQYYQQPQQPQQMVSVLNAQGQLIGSVPVGQQPQGCVLVTAQNGQQFWQQQQQIQPVQPLQPVQQPLQYIQQNPYGQHVALPQQPVHVAPISTYNTGSNNGGLKGYSS